MTGRISSEKVHKVAPSTGHIRRYFPYIPPATDLAEKRYVTLIGYAKRHRSDVYTHPEGIA